MLKLEKLLGHGVRGGSEDRPDQCTDPADEGPAEKQVQDEDGPEVEMSNGQEGWQEEKRRAEEQDCEQNPSMAEIILKLSQFPGAGCEGARAIERVSRHRWVQAHGSLGKPLILVNEFEQLVGIALQFPFGPRGRDEQCAEKSAQ